MKKPIPRRGAIMAIRAALAQRFPATRFWVRRQQPDWYVIRWENKCPEEEVATFVSTLNMNADQFFIQYEAPE